MIHRVNARSLIGWMPVALLFAVSAMPIRGAEIDAVASAGHRVVLLAPSGPLILAVRLETGSQSIGQVRAAFCESLFKRLDADNSGKLDSAEQAHVPAFRRAGGGSGESVQTFLNDGQLTPDGLRKYIDGQLGPEFAVEIKPPRLDQSVRLIDVLDVDGDGVLSVKEVVNSSQLLSRHDLDDDESLSVSELQPFPQSVRQAMQAEAEQAGRGVRIFLVGDPAAVESAATEILKSFATGDGVDIKRCGLAPKRSAVFDENHDGLFSAAELRKWIEDGTTDFEIRAQWRSRGLPPALQVAASDAGRVAVQPGISRSRWNAKVDGVPLQVSLFDNRSSAGDAVSFFLTEARRRDLDKNDYLDEAEFAGLGTGAPFAAVDLNHDGMVVREEIRQYFEDMSRLSQARVVMTFSDEVTSLFQLMDADRSNRLSVREMASLQDRLAPQDRNGNGLFDPGDFVSEFKLSMAFSVPQGLEATGGGMAMTGTTGGVRGTFRSGPLWFQRMDRNRDHDISWREFLGPRAKFDALDSNRDGLISREEAEAADAVAASDKLQPSVDGASAP